MGTPVWLLIGYILAATPHPREMVTIGNAMAGWKETYATQAECAAAAPAAWEHFSKGRPVALTCVQGWVFEPTTH